MALRFFRRNSFVRVLKYSPTQTRDRQGRFAFMGGRSTGTSEPTPEDLEAAKKKVAVIRAKMAEINNQLLEHVDNETMGSPEAKEKLNALKALSKEMYQLDADPGGFEGIGLPGGPRDVVIVGAGPAGLSAAINGGTEGLDTLYIDASAEVGGQAKFSSRIENFAGFPGGVTGGHLARDMHEQAQRVGTEHMLGVRVTGLEHDPQTGLKTLTLSNGQKIVSRTVIIAGGLEFRKPTFPGSHSSSVSVGNGEQLTRDGEGGDVIVVGGANSAAQAALGAARRAKTVTVIARSGTQSMSASQLEALENHPKIKIIKGDEIESLQTDEHGKATEITLRSGRRLPAKAVGVFIGSRPTTEWLPSGVQRSKEGKVTVDENLETGIPGVFAVGDVRGAGESGKAGRSGTRTLGRVGAAVGEGQVAIANVFQYFEREKEADRTTVAKSEEGARRERERKIRARATKRKEKFRWNRNVDRSFELDEKNPDFMDVEDVPDTEPVRKFTTVLKYSPTQPRDDQGQFARSGQSLIDRLKDPDGGFAVNAVTGESPSTGYAVSIYKGRERTLPAKTMTPLDLIKYVKDNQDLITQDGNYLGAWHNPDDDRVYLDVTKVTTDQAEAERLGRENNQLAIFDLGKHQVIDVQRAA